MLNLVAICGSLRADSLNKKLMNAFIKSAPSDVKIEVLNYSDFPMFNQDLEANFPAQVTEVKDKMKSADGILIFTPEYNRGIPGVLKNMIDWTSRPYGDSAWNGKPVGVLGASSGNIGTAVAQNSLKMILNYLNTHVLGQPEFYLNATPVFAENGDVKDESTQQHIEKFLAAFINHAKKFKV